MSDEDFDEEPELDEEMLEEEPDLEDDDALEADEDLDLDLVDETELVVAVPEADDADADVVLEDDEDEDVLELEEEQHPDDVEAPLDALLQERTASATLEDEDDELEDEEGDVDERGDGATRIVPRRPGEFLCSSCFLVLPRNQLADATRMLCRDCA
jgi:hypothetical protein